MEPKFVASQVEQQIYKMWEDKGLFVGTPNAKKKPFTIILPPPNANANLHLGHAMYVYEDIMIRYHKIQGFETLWLPGADHAGTETQFVYEKHLAKEGKSRFDFDRETLFKNIWDFVMQNRGNMENQLRRLGFALDWSKKKFTMDPDIVHVVYRTFKDLHDQGLIYRAQRLVNYCTKDGTSFSDLEVVTKDVEGLLYYIKYPLKDGSGSISVATTRPETLLGDVAVMVNPTDKRYLKLIGKTVLLPLTNREIPIIADDYVDKKFGTGAVKVTPAHDFNDFEVGKRHKLYRPPVIGLNGKMQNSGVPEVDGLRVKPAREAVVKLLQEQGFLEQIKPHAMVNKVCYKCNTILEPMPMEQWFVKVRPLADEAIKLVKEKKVTIYPKRFERIALQWLTDFHDWNISRQNVWGIRIPAYRCVKENSWFIASEKPDKCQICSSCQFEHDTDTFDTWFSSGQWPFATLETQGKEIYNYFYPTTVMETGYDILPWWVVRMIMLGYYATKNVPFENVFLHGLVRDKHGQKMSKSKGNVINPLEMVDKYGADALRAALVFGVSEGSDALFAEEKVVGMRNFCNKIWNIGRLIYMSQTPNEDLKAPTDAAETEKILKELNKEFKAIEKQYHKNMKSYKFSQGLDLTYQFIWHRFADYYLEKLKQELRNGNIRVLDTLKEIYFSNLVLLHPFIPFVTEALWQVFHPNTSILEGNS